MCDYSDVYIFVKREADYAASENNKAKKDAAFKRNVNSPTQFCLATISEKSSAVESRELSLKGNEYDFSWL